jgi:hypothetical protein
MKARSQHLHILRSDPGERHITGANQHNNHGHEGIKLLTPSIGIGRDSDETR